MGAVEGTNAFIAVVASAGQAVVYVCDGESDIAEWFFGPLDDERHLDLPNDHGAHVTAVVVGDTFSRTVRFADGSEHGFTTEHAVPGAGIYRVTGDNATNAGVVAGWVVNNEGEQRGSLRVNGRNQLAALLPASTLTMAGTNVQISAFVARPSGPGPVHIPYPDTPHPIAPTIAPTCKFHPWPKCQGVR